MSLSGEAGARIRRQLTARFYRAERCRLNRQRQGHQKTEAGQALQQFDLPPKVRQRFNPCFQLAVQRFDLPLAATGCYGLASNLTHAKLRGAPPLGTVLGAMLTSGVLLAPVTPFFPAPAPPDLRVVPSVLALGLVCTGLAYALYLPLIVRLGGTRSASVSFLVPVFALGWSAAFLHEALTVQKLVACGVILLGGGLITGVLARPAERGRKLHSPELSREGSTT